MQVLVKDLTFRKQHTYGGFLYHFLYFIHILLLLITSIKVHQTFRFIILLLSIANKNVALNSPYSFLSAAPTSTFRKSESTYRFQNLHDL